MDKKKLAMIMALAEMFAPGALSSASEKASENERWEQFKKDHPIKDSSSRSLKGK